MEKLTHHTDWLFWILLLIVSLVLAARLYNPARFSAFLTLPFNVKRSELESSFNPAVGRGLFDISLGLVSYLVIGLALFLLLHPYNGEFPLLQDWVMYLRLLFILPAFFLVKNLMGLFVGWIFSKSEEIGHVQMVSLAYRSWLAILLIPLCCLLVYFQPLYQLFYYILAFSLVVGYLISVQFSFMKLWNMHTLAYYKIFYLCALEITPLIFLVGWLQSLYR